MVLYGSASQAAKVTSGVPQGSILGPLLFIVFMDSISSLALSPRARLTIFADDICYVKEVTGEEDCRVVQSDVDMIFNWSAVKDLRLNSSKTKSVGRGSHLVSQ